MFPSDLDFFPVISESKTLEFPGKQRLHCICGYPVRCGSPPCPFHQTLSEGSDSLQICLQHLAEGKSAWFGQSLEPLWFH